MSFKIFITVMIFSLGTGSISYAEEIAKIPEHLKTKDKDVTARIYDNKLSVMVPYKGKMVKITRRKTPAAMIFGELQPILPVKGIHPIGEVEVLKALQDSSFKVIDMRAEHWRAQSSIPGSIHIPYNEVASRLDELGCLKTGKKWDCKKAVKVVALCNGANCPQSPTGIKAMVREGYPANLIYHYRGGMNSWIVMGLSVNKGQF